MFCEKCGKELQEGAKFCEGCGAPTQNAPAEVKAPVQEEVKPAPVEKEAAPAPQVINNFYQEEKRDAVGVAGWIFRPLLALIPIAGPIVYLIMLFVWAGDKSKEKSFNNWAKAQLILLLIFVGIAVVVGIIVGIIAFISANALSDAFGGSIYYY